ncbi:MAG: hypothetical protein PVG90_11750 [Bacillota bacterium]|jgi:hypothetical protein
MKKWLTALVTIWLVFSLNMVTRAEYRKIYFEYKKEENIDDFRPKIGLNWEINNKWATYSSYEFNGDEEKNFYLEVEYKFCVPYSLGLFGETVDSEDSLGFYVNLDCAVNERLWIKGRLTYTANHPQGVKAANPDYDEWKLNGELSYRLNEKLTGLANCYWTLIGLEDQESWDDFYSKELEVSAGLEYLVNKALRVSGSCVRTITNYNSSASHEDETVNKYIVGAVYNIKKFDLYLSYDFPAVDENTATFGVAYTF